jgi:hypothetical protein
MQSLIMIGQFLNALQANEQADFDVTTGSYYMVDSSSADLYIGLGDEGYTYTVNASDGDDVTDAPLTSVSQLKTLMARYCKLA